MAKATSAHRAHFERIGRAAEALERTRQELAAKQDPASKIEEALRLSNALLRGAEVGDPPPKRFSLIARWREVQARGKHGRDRG